MTNHKLNPRSSTASLSDASLALSFSNSHEGRAIRLSGKLYQLRFFMPGGIDTKALCNHCWDDTMIASLNLPVHQQLNLSVTLHLLSGSCLFIATAPYSLLDVLNVLKEQNFFVTERIFAVLIEAGFLTFSPSFSEESFCFYRNEATKHCAAEISSRKREPVLAHR